MMAEEEKELSGVTFKPAINRNADRVGSYLKVLDEPHTYLMRLQEANQRLDNRKMALKQEEEEKIYAECTFTPKTIDAPNYVKKMAETARIMKENESVKNLRSQILDHSWR